jgi:hypothetical protein
MSEQKHPAMIAIEATHQDVKVLHPLLALLDQEGSGEDPLMLLAELLAAIEARLSAIEAAVSISSSEPVEL